MGSRSRVGDVLVKAGVIDARQMDSALAHMDRWGAAGGRLTKAIHDLGIVGDDEVADALSRALKLPRLQLKGLPPDAMALSRLPLSFCEPRGVFPIGMGDQNRTLQLAMADPTDLSTVDQAAAMARTRILPVVAGEQEIHRAQALHFRGMNLPGATQTPHATPAVVAALELELDDDSVRARAATSQVMVQEILAHADVASWSKADQERLEQVMKHQAQSSRILEALLELLVEKRLMRQSALTAWRNGDPLPPMPQLRTSQ